MRAVVFFLVLLMFSISFGKHIRKVKIKEIDINFVRNIQNDNEQLKQKINAKVPLIIFPYKDDIFKKVKKEIIDITVPVIGDPTLIDFTSDYKIGVNNGRIFSIKLIQYEYFSKASHGNSEVLAINLDLKCRRFIKFFDIFDETKHIFDPETNTYKEIFPLDEIKKILRKRIEEKNCKVFEEEFKKCSFIPQIFLTEDGIEFIFSKYEVTPGNCGSFSIKLPYDMLKIYMREDVNFLPLKK